jgi:hypothetical protein
MGIIVTLIAVWPIRLAKVHVNVKKLCSRARIIWVGCALLAWTGNAMTEEPQSTLEGPETAADKEPYLGRTVDLPAYVVSATQIDKHPWRYGTVPGFEILTRASDEDTGSLLDVVRLGMWIDDKILPANWRPQAPVPYTVIADDTDSGTVRESGLYAAPLERSGTKSELGFGPEPFGHTTGMVLAGDADTCALDSDLYDMPTLHIASPMKHERMDRCSPPLPPWLRAGLDGHFGVLRMVIETSQNPNSVTTRNEKIRGVMWISNEETEHLMQEIVEKRGKKIEIPFIPLGRFFTQPPPQGESRELWESEAELFVHWGLFAPKRDTASWRHDFLEFTQRARCEQVTEPLFKECFGHNFAEMEKILTDYLKEVIAKPVELDLGSPPDAPWPALRPATADQIGRILGDWLRMQGRLTRPKDPSMGAKLFDAAGRMLTRAYAIDNGLPPDAEPAPQEEGGARIIPKKTNGPVVRMTSFVVTAERIHDAGLLAVFGLYEHDIGDDSMARSFLEKAAKAGADRPEAYLVLAQLRYAEAMARPLGERGRLSAQQTAFVLEPAQVSLHSSITADTVGLFVDTLSHFESKPSIADIEKTVEIALRFPADSGLALRTARLCIETGNLHLAAQVIDVSSAFAMDDSSRMEFQQLRSALNQPVGRP